MVLSSLVGTVFVIVIIIVNIFVVLASYIRNPNRLLNKIFAVTGIILNLWVIFTYISIQPFTTTPVADFLGLFFIRISIFFAVPMSLLFFLLSNILPEEKLKLNKWLLAILLILNFLIMILAISPYTFSSITITNGFPTPQPGRGIGIFAGYVLGLNFTGAYVLLRKIRKYTGVHREQLRYFTTGLLLMQGLTVFTILIPTNVFQNPFFVPFAPLYALIFIIMTTNAMIRHRLLDIRLMVVRSITYFLSLLVIGAGYSTFFVIINNYINNSKLSFESIFISTAGTLIILFAFQPLRRVFEKLTDKVFYRDHYDANDLLWSLSRIMASTLLLTDLAKQILKKLLEEMKINYGAIVLVKNKSIFWVESAGEVSSHPFDNAGAYTLVYDSYHTTNHKEHIFIFEELPEGKIKKLMRKQDLTVVMPLTVRHELIGGLMLGQKSSGEIYSSEDIDVLKILAPEIAVAVRNALSYEEIKKFNVTLENEVDRATQRLRAANHRLKELDHLKDEFVSIASHELRTPMTAIKSYLWMAINQPKQNIKDPLKNYLNISYNSTERLIRLVNDMLTVSRIERNKIELKKAPIDIVEVAQLVHDELKITADEKNITFNFEHPKKKLIINGDKDKLREVIQNIVGNALKFTPEQGSITIKAEEKGNLAHVSVTDTASGIPKEELPNLFKKFSKIEYSYSKHSSQPGTGLGLYISKQIVSLHNGDIKVQSEVGVGSTFTVLLPLYKGKGGDNET